LFFKILIIYINILACSGSPDPDAEYRYELGDLGRSLAVLKAGVVGTRDYDDALAVAQLLASGGVAWQSVRRALECVAKGFFGVLVATRGCGGSSRSFWYPIRRMPSMYGIKKSKKSKKAKKAKQKDFSWQG
jgi:hypothetical protein